MNNSFALILPSAGRGNRFGEKVPKQYFKLENISILELSLSPFLEFPECCGVCVPKANDDLYWKNLDLKTSNIHFINGGKTRLESVAQGVKFWKESKIDFSYIIIHDSVRPCLKSVDIRSLLEALESKQVDGAILGVPAIDTMKIVSDKDLMIVNTAERKPLWMAYTPQVFRKEVLFKAFQSVVLNGDFFRDEASLVETISRKIKMVEGSRDNIKVTYPEDVNLVRFILEEQGRIKN